MKPDELRKAAKLAPRRTCRDAPVGYSRLMASHDDGRVGRLGAGPARASRTREPEVREVDGVAVLVAGPEAARVADVFAALVPRLSASDRRSLGALVLVEVDPAAERNQRLLEGNWAFSTYVLGTNTILLRREVGYLSDGALAFLVAHETAHLVHYGRGDLHHLEEEAERLAASWGGPTVGETWREFRDSWARVPVGERGGIPAWSESPKALS